MIIGGGYFMFLLLLLSRDGASLDLKKAAPVLVISSSLSLKQTSPTLFLTRRDAWRVSTFALVTTTTIHTNEQPGNIVALALESENTIVGTFVKGTVNLPANVENPPRPPVLQADDNIGTTATKSTTTTPALYITCRPDRPDNVPQAILAGTRGKPPPVLAARFENPSYFPFSFALGEQDLTMEGAAVKDEKTGLYWWMHNDNNSNNLVVSARWDSDGIAATRSPEDLVGRAMAAKQQQQQQQQQKQGNGNVPSSSSSMYTVTIDLGGRGAFGKFATGGGGTAGNKK